MQKKNLSPPWIKSQVGTHELHFEAPTLDSTRRTILKRKGICAEPDCMQDRHTGNYCNRHYLSHWRKGTHNDKG